MARALLLCVLVAIVAVPAARADGDPASDVLLFQKVFQSFYAPVPKQSLAELKRVVAEANRRGYKVRVALIGDKGDLGAVPSFWRKPQDYAVFLGQEVSLVPTGPYKNRVLVVMPNGYGLSVNGKGLGAERPALAGVKAPEAAGEDLGAGGIRAVQALAAAKGVQIEADVPGGSGGGSHTTLVIAAVAIMLAAVAAGVAIALRMRRRA